MVSYANTNALSMLGGDDYSDVVASLTNYVTLTTPQTILSGADKTHQEINTFNNTTNIAGALSVNSGSVDIQAGGTCLYQANATNMSLIALDTNYTGVEGSMLIEADQDLTIRRTSASGFEGTLGIISNGNIDILTLDPLALGTGTITVQADRDLNLFSTLNTTINTAQGIELSADIYYSLFVDGALKETATNLYTSNTNLTITEVATTAYKVQNVSGTDKLNIAPTLTTNTNATITDVATARKFQAVSGTDIFNITGTGVSSIVNMNITKNVSTDSSAILLITNGYLNATEPYLYVKKGFSALGSYGTRLYTGKLSNDFISVGGLETETDVLTWDSANFNCLTATQTYLAGTAFKVQNAGGVDKINVNPMDTTIINGEVAITSQTSDLYITASDAVVLTGTLNGVVVYGGPNIKASYGLSLTTLTNTNVDIVAPLHATSYHVGSTASSVPLLSHQITVGRLLPTSASGTFTYDMNFGNNSTTLTSVLHRQPNIRIIPTYAILFCDSGTFTTGGGSITCSILVLNSAGTTCYTSSSTTVASGSNVRGTLTMTENLALVTDGTYKIQLEVVAGTSITVSTKNIYATLYSQQV